MLRPWGWIALGRGLVPSLPPPGQASRGPQTLQWELDILSFPRPIFPKEEPGFSRHRDEERSWSPETGTPGRADHGNVGQGDSILCCLGGGTHLAPLEVSLWLPPSTAVNRLRACPDHLAREGPCIPFVCHPWLRTLLNPPLYANHPSLPGLCGFGDQIQGHCTSWEPPRKCYFEKEFQMNSDKPE